MFFKVKKIREEKGISQQELSELSDVSRTTISGMETGAVKNANADTLMKIAKALGVKVSDIFFENDV